MIRPRRHSYGLLLGAAIVSATLAPTRQALAGDFLLRPSLSVGEEYTDNILETAQGRKTEFTTRVRPSAALGYRTPFLAVDGTYTFDLRKYARGTHGDENIHTLDFKGTAELLENLLYLDVTDSLHKTTVNVARDVESESLLADRTTQNILSVSPFLLWRPSDKASVRSGYSYSDIRYWDGAGLDKGEHGGFLDITHHISENVSLYGAYTFTRGEASIVSYDRHDAIAGFRYAYADNCFIFGRAGNSWQRFSGGIRTSNLLWDAGIAHDFRFATGLLETKVEQALDPSTISTREISYTGRVSKAFDRGAIGLSGTYAEYYITQIDLLEHRRLSVTGTGRYEVRPRLSLSVSVTGDRFSRNSDTDTPYRLTASGALNYGFYNEYTALSVSYTYRQDRRWLDSSAGEKVINRLLIEARTGY